MDALRELGIDWWGVLIYIINTLLLLLLLTHLLYKPLLKAIDERRSTIKNTLLESETLRRSLDAERARQEAASHAAERALREEIQATKQELHRIAEAEREQARAERAALLERAHQEITEAKAHILEESRTDIVRIMEKALLTLARTSIPSETVNKSIEDAARELSSPSSR